MYDRAGFERDGFRIFRSFSVAIRFYLAMPKSMHLAAGLLAATLICSAEARITRRKTNRFFMMRFGL
jgi:hypothetical protein